MKITFLLFALLVTDITPPSQWQNPANWQRIRVGVTTDAVKQVLGEPATSESSRTLEVWYYQDVPENGTHPSVGRLIFRKSPEGTALKEFNQPDWSKLPTWGELNQTYRDQQRQEQIAQAEERRTLQMQNQPKPQPLVQRQAPVVRRTKPANTYTPPPAKPDTQSQNASRYFIYTGIGIGLMGIVIGVARGLKILQ